MSEDAIIQLKWGYTPKDFFEEKETNLLPGYDHTIENGEVTIFMDESQNPHDIQEQIGNRLIGIFRGAALVSQRPFTLQYGGMETVNPDGRKIVNLQITFKSKMAMAFVDYTIEGQDGLVITDTKKERQKKRRKFSILSLKHIKDPVVDSILSSYEKSLNNPQTELVHLYEIRDSLSKRFSGEAKAKKELGISNSKWSKLGQLANHEPVNQGRHSGVHISVLRDATESELKEARNIAIDMVVSYLEYLEANSSKLP